MTSEILAEFDKSGFHVHTVKYLGLTITTEGIKMDPDQDRDRRKHHS
jgi:hypothetical protein